MTAIPLPRKPPQLYPRILTRGNFAQDLACVLWCNEPGGDVIEAVHNVRLVKTGAGTRVNSRIGLGAKVVGNATSGWTGPAGFTPIKTSNGVGTGNFTFLIIEDTPNVATAGFSGFAQGDTTKGFQSNHNSTSAGAAAAGRTGFECYGTSSSFCVSPATVTDGTPHVKVCRQVVAGAVATLSVFVDGVLPTQSVAGTTVNDIRGATPTAGTLAINDDGEGTGAVPAVYFVCAWNRALSDAECIYISKMLWYELLDYSHIWNKPNEIVPWWVQATGAIHRNATGAAVFLTTALLRTRLLASATATFSETSLLRTRLLATAAAVFSSGTETLRKRYSAAGTAVFSQASLLRTRLKSVATAVFGSSSLLRGRIQASSSAVFTSTTRLRSRLLASALAVFNGTVTRKVLIRITTVRNNADFRVTKAVLRLIMRRVPGGLVDDTLRLRS